MEANQTKQTKETKQTLSRMTVNCGCISEDIDAYNNQALLTKNLKRREEYFQHVQILRRIFSENCN